MNRYIESDQFRERVRSPILLNLHRRGKAKWCWAERSVGSWRQRFHQDHTNGLQRVWRWGWAPWLASRLCLCTFFPTHFCRKELLCFLQRSQAMLVILTAAILVTSRWKALYKHFLYSILWGWFLQQHHEVGMITLIFQIGKSAQRG